MGISDNSLHWDQTGMGNKGLFVNGNIMKWEHQEIPYTGMTLEWELKGYFQVQ